MFRPWHPSGSKQRGSASSRGLQRTTSSRPLTHQEDAQPNESVDKRQRCPPAISRAVPPQQPPRRGGQGPRRNMHFVPWDPSAGGSTRYAPPPSTYRVPLATGGVPTPSNTTEPASGYAWSSGHAVSTPSVQPSQPSPPKRRKLERPPPVAEMNLGSRTGGVVPAPTPSMSPVSSETLVGEQGVKKERSISPELSPTEPQLITAGTKRYVPLPPECRKSQPNFKAARNAWAWKEQAALRRLGFKVVRTFVREDGMAIDWETTVDTHPAAMATVIEPAVLLDRAMVSDRTTQSVKPTTTSLAHATPDLNQPDVERETSSPSVVEIAPPVPLNAGRGRKSIEGSSSSAVVGQMSNRSSGPYLEGGSQQHERPSANTIDTPAPITSLRRSPRKSEHNSPSGYSQLHQSASSVPSRTAPPSGQTLKQSTNPPSPLGPSQQRTALSQPLPSPSQRARDTLQNILHLKRQFGRDSSESPKLPAVSSPSPLRKLYPLPRTPRSGSPSQRSPGSFADTVAAAINEGSRLDRQGSSGTPVPSTPLRAYKKRTSPLATPVQRNEGSATPREDEEHQTRRSQSSGHSTPPIEVLGPESSSESWKASSSVYGEEYDELELSYPPSPVRPSPRPPPNSLPLSNVPTDPPRPAAEPVEQATQPLRSGFRQPSPGEIALKNHMRSLAMRYLELYYGTFDVDRRALAEAYAPDAVFSCSSRNLRAQGREGIVDALQALGPGILCESDLELDVLYLGPQTGVLLVTLGIMRNTRGDDTGEVGYAMSILLQPGREDRESKLPGELWPPLVAAVHQMVLREDLPRMSGALMS